MSAMKQIDGYKIYMNKLLGKGSFGAVYIGVSDKTQEKVAVKILSKSSIDADEYLKNALFSEIKIMECIKSENIVGFYDVMESSKNYYIVQELCDGDLSALMKGGQVITQKKAVQYLLQMANGFLALVREGIIHRDLKPANIMLKGDKIKIGDFGFAKKSQTASKMLNQTIVGSPLYMPIEVLKGLSYSSKCDIWALGFIFYQMLHGYPPWFAKNQYELIKKIETKPLEMNENLGNYTKDFLRKTLGLSQQKRISWDQLFVHPIFNGYFLNNTNRQFQNKLKMIMSELRFQINAQNIDLYKVLASLGYNNGHNQLDKPKFFQFLRIVHPDITRQASDYIFNKTDYDRNGTISINQIEKILNQNNITLTTANNKIPGFIKNQNNTESFTSIPQQVQIKIKACFVKLMRQLIRNNYSLKQVFNDFDKQKRGSMSRDSFRNMLKQISKDLNYDEIDAAFGLIDEDNSNSIQFKQLNNYYTKVNGLVEVEKKTSLDNMMDQENYYTSKSRNYNNNNNNNNNNYQNYEQQNNFPGNFNPFGALLNPSGYYGMPPPNMYGGYPMNGMPNMNMNGMGYYPQNQQSPPNNSGNMFGNYIMDQLSQNYSSSKRGNGW